MGADPSPLRVLLVDDAPDLRMLLRSLLDGVPDVEVAEAACGEDALAEAARRRPDLVVMDQNMPGMDGVATTRAMKELCPDTEVVAFTAVPGAEREFAAAGAAAHFLKDRFGDLVDYISARAVARRRAA